jgi:hypothetical protein
MMDNELQIATYAKLKKVIREFKKGSFDFLIIVGDAGLGKTYNTRRILGDRICYVNSHTTVLGLYEEAYNKRDLPIWVDDIDGLFNTEKMIGLLKQLCETSPTKTVQYNTSWKMDKTRKLPKSFKTSSKVIMTVNSITRLKNKGIQSLLDRAIMLRFQPSKKELVAYIQCNFSEIYNKEILDYFFDNNLRFSLRDYIKRYQLTKVGLI